MDTCSRLALEGLLRFYDSNQYFRRCRVPNHGCAQPDFSATLYTSVAGIYRDPEAIGIIILLMHRFPRNFAITTCQLACCWEGCWQTAKVLFFVVPLSGPLTMLG